MRVKRKKKECKQSLCPHFLDCPFSRDVSKCKHALAVDTPAHEVLQID